MCKMMLDILCESSADRQFTQNVKRYHVTNNSNKICKCRLLKISKTTGADDEVCDLSKFYAWGKIRLKAGGSHEI